MRPLVSDSIYTKKEKKWANQIVSTDKPKHSLAVCTCTLWVHPPTHLPLSVEAEPISEGQCRKGPHKADDVYMRVGP